MKLGTLGKVVACSIYITIMLMLTGITLVLVLPDGETNWLAGVAVFATFLAMMGTVTIVAYAMWKNW